jgi:hypothetical protein
MTKLALSSAGLCAALALGACTGDGTGEADLRYVKSPDTVIALAADQGRDAVGLAPGGAAIVYDGDGCQAWLIDDGVEGYSGRRFDPRTGLPICDHAYPPGTVLGNYQSATPGIEDYTPRVKSN